MPTKLTKRFLLLVILSPFFWWLVFRPGGLIKEWASYPEYAAEKVKGVFSGDYIANVNEMRWEAFGEEREDFLSKVYYNKGLVLVNELAEYTTYLSPRFYFQSGGGEGFSPHNVEPIAIPLFFFWVLGIVHLLKKKEFKPFLFVLGFSLLAFLGGRKSMAFLFPVAVIYLFIAYKGIEDSFKKIDLRYVYLGIVLYLLFILGRMLWIS